MYFFISGKLQYPPKKSRIEEEKERRLEEARIRRKNAKLPGLVPIRDLLNGEYWKRKEEEKQQLEARRVKRLMRMKEKQSLMTLDSKA